MVSSAISVDTGSALGIASGDIIGGLVGQRLGRYELVRFMGRGGMADVYAARRDGSSARVALKRMLPRLAARPKLVELFLHEARIHSLLKHENLVHCIDFDASGDVPFLVLELVDGVGCDSVLRWGEHRAMPVPFALTVLSGVLTALAFAHEATDATGTPLDIVHHDVSLDNVLITQSGAVKLLDFGVAHSALSPERTVPCELRGKLCYMAPEQIAGLPTDRRSDLFSAGVVLAELVLGRHLFTAREELRLLMKTYEADLEVLHEAAELLPPSLLLLLERALARDPAARFQTGREFLTAIEEVARVTGGLADGGDLVAWLRSQSLLPSASGVHPIVTRGEGTDVVIDKIEAARPALCSLSPESRRAPTPSTRCMAAVTSPVERYDVRNAKGEIAPNLTCSEVVELLVTGRVGFDTPIATPTGGISRVGEEPRFAQLAATPAYRFDDGVERRAAWSLPLNRPELPSILFGLARSKARGVLSLWMGNRRKRIYFDHGAPIFVASSDPSELLGRALVARGLISASALDPLIELATRQRRHLGEAIVAARKASSGEVVRLLVSQLERRVLEIGQWTVGQLAFTPGARPGLQTARPLGPSATLACQLVRSAYVDSEISGFLRDVAGCPLSRSPTSVAGLNAVPLSGLEAEIVGRAAGARDLTRAIDDLAEREVATPQTSRRALFLALSAGLLVSPGFAGPFPLA